MCQDARREVLARRGFRPDGWVWVALGVTAASFTGLFLIHFLPLSPALAFEGWDHVAIPWLYGPTVFGCFVWPAVATVRRRYHAGWQYSLRSLLIAVFVVAFFIHVLSFKVFPVVAILLAGAIGGAVSWGLRRRIVAKSDPPPSGRLAKASLILFVIAAAILLADIAGPVLLSSGGVYGIEIDSRLHDQLQFLAFLSLPFILILLAIGSLLGTIEWHAARKASARPSRMTVVAASLNLASLLIGAILILAFILFLVGPTTDVVPRWPGR